MEAFLIFPMKRETTTATLPIPFPLCLSAIHNLTSYYQP